MITFKKIIFFDIQSTPELSMHLLVLLPSRMGCMRHREKPQRRQNCQQKALLNHQSKMLCLYFKNKNNKKGRKPGSRKRV